MLLKENLLNSQAETRGWQILNDLVSVAQLTDHDLKCIDAALGFPITSYAVKDSGKKAV